MTPDRRSSALFLLLALALFSGCSTAAKVESVEEGTAAAQRAASADASAQAAAGAQGLTGTSSSIPSLVPGEGQVQLPAPAVPATAPPADKFNNDDPGHLLARCRDRSARNEWFDAVGDCRRAQELAPSWVEPQVELMRLLVTLQSYADAEEAALKVLAARPNDDVALYYLAWSYRGRDQFPKAIATLQRAVAAAPKRIEYVQALGMTYCLADNYGKGIETLERALAMDPGNAKTQGAIRSARAVLADRLAPYIRLVKEKPESFDNHAALGFMLQKYGLSQRALSEYDTALAKMPPLSSQDADMKKMAAQLYYNRGVVYRDLGKPTEAEPALWQAMQLDPGLAAFSWYYIGLARYDAGKYDTSIDALRKSIDLAPDVADNRAALADSYAKAGKADLAAEQRNLANALRSASDEAAEANARAEADAEARRKEAAAAARPAAPTVPETSVDAAAAVPAAPAPETAPVPAAAPEAAGAAGEAQAPAEAALP